MKKIILFLILVFISFNICVASDIELIAKIAPYGDGFQGMVNEDQVIDTNTTAGNLMISGGSYFKSIAMSGDVTITSAGVTTVGDNIAVTSWNLTTPTLTTSTTVTDGFTFGLGTGKGGIQFDDEITDFISFSNCNVGIGTTTPVQKLHVAGDVVLEEESPDITLWDSGTNKGWIMHASDTTESSGYGEWQLWRATGTVANPTIGDKPPAMFATSDLKIHFPNGIVTDLDKTIILKPFVEAQTITTGDSKIIFTVPPEMDGMNLTGVGGHVYTISSSGNVTVTIFNLTKNVDMLSTALTIDAGEKDSITAATPAVINTATDNVSTADEIEINVDGAGTNAQGLEPRLTFKRS